MTMTMLMRIGSQGPLFSAAGYISDIMEQYCDINQVEVVVDGGLSDGQLLKVWEPAYRQIVVYEAVSAYLASVEGEEVEVDYFVDDSLVNDILDAIANE